MTDQARIDARGAVAPPLALVGAVIGSATAAAVLHRLGSGPLAAPPLQSWAALTRWYETALPPLAMIAMVRCIALALAGWLFIASTLQMLGAVPALGILRGLADSISPRSLQRFGHGLAGLSLTAGLAVVVPSAGTPPTAAGRSTPVAAAGDDPTTSPVTGDPGTAVLRLVDDAEPVLEPRAGDEVTVAVGDSLWSIAVDVLAEHMGVPPSDRQVTPYWRSLIDANRAKLVDPTNPDLIFPGQVFTLPPA